MSDALQALFNGIYPASIYSLVALGFVIIYKATGIVNLAYPVLLALGAFEVTWLSVTMGVPFWLAVIGAMAAAAAVSALIERVVMRPMVGQPPFSAVMVTVGVFIGGDVLVNDLIGTTERSLGDPWQFQSFSIGGADLFQRNVASLVIAGVAVTLLLSFFRWSRLGTAMRATSFDQEAALAMGIPVGRVFTVSWAMSGALGALAGMMAASGGNSVTQTTSFVALVALPVIILGGLDSVGGAVVAAAIIGLAEGVVSVYQPEYARFLGSTFREVVPYLIMLLVLLVRPYGLWGTPEIERV